MTAQRTAHFDPRTVARSAEGEPATRLSFVGVKKGSPYADQLDGPVLSGPDFLNLSVNQRQPVLVTILLVVLPVIVVINGIMDIVAGEGVSVMTVITTVITALTYVASWLIAQARRVRVHECNVYEKCWEKLAGGFVFYHLSRTAEGEGRRAASYSKMTRSGEETGTVGWHGTERETAHIELYDAVTLYLDRYSPVNAYMVDKAEHLFTKLGRLIERKVSLDKRRGAGAYISDTTLESEAQWEVDCSALIAEFMAEAERNGRASELNAQGEKGTDMVEIVSLDPVPETAVTVRER